MSDMILVTGVVDLDPSKRDDFIAACTELMTATREETGCEHYIFSADLDDPGRFHLSERWESAVAMAAHSGTPHFASFMGKMGGFGVTGASITKWTGASGSPLM
jgi:quinol monooxygenase YgiN